MLAPSAFTIGTKDIHRLYLCFTIVLSLSIAPESFVLMGKVPGKRTRRGTNQARLLTVERSTAHRT